MGMADRTPVMTYETWESAIRGRADAVLLSRVGEV